MGNFQFTFRGSCYFMLLTNTHLIEFINPIFTLMFVFPIQTSISWLIFKTISNANVPTVGIVDYL